MISIITPSFRQLDWLRLAIASVGDEERVELEHLVQDAGTDGILPWAETHFRDLLSAKRLRIFSEKDAGMYDAINRGLAKSSGQICAYLNCDEQYLPDTARRVAAFFSSNPDVDVVFGDAMIVDSDGQALAYRRAIAPTLAHMRASHLNIFSCATFFRRRILDAGHLLDPKWKSIGDAIWIYRMLEAGLRLAVLPELLSVFTLTGQNLSMRDPRSEVERRAWLAEVGKPSTVARYAQVALHRGRKLLAGAYRTRTFDYHIYTLHSPGQRVRFHAESLGGTWPAMTS